MNTQGPGTVTRIGAQLTSQELALEVHGIERICNLVIVGLNLGCKE